MAIETGKKKRYESCAEFFELASEFYAGDLAMVCKCSILSAAAMINAEEQIKAPMPDSTVKKAIDMLGRAGKMLPSILASEDPRLFFLHTYNTYQLLSSLDIETTRTQKLQLVKSYVASKSCTAPDLLQLGLTLLRVGGQTTRLFNLLSPAASRIFLHRHVQTTRLSALLCGS